MSEIRYNNESGKLGAALSSAGTTITFAAVPDFASLASPDFIKLPLDENTLSYEIVYLTAYTQGSLTGTIARAQEDATNWPATTHQSGAVWTCAPTVADFTTGLSSVYAPLASPALTGVPTVNALPFAYASSVVVPPSGDTTGAGDVAALNAALASATTNGGGNVKGVAGQTYYVNAPVIQGSNSILDLTQCTIIEVAGSNCNMWQNAAVTPVATATDGAMTSTQNTVVTSLAVSASVGQTIVVGSLGGTQCPGNGGHSPLTGVISAINTGTLTITIVKLATGLSCPAQATVTGAAVALYNRDVNVKQIGGTWNRGANNAPAPSTTELPAYSWLCRHVDHVTIIPENFLSTNGKEAINAGDFTNGTFSMYSGGASSAGVQLIGPFYICSIPSMTGTYGDDVVAALGSDWPTNNDSSGDIFGLTVGTISAKSNANLFKVIAGVGLVADAVKVTGQIIGTAGTGAAANMVWVGNDATQAATTGGNYGEIDLGTIAASSTTVDTALVMFSPAAAHIKANLINNGFGATGVMAQLGGTQVATIDHLELTGNVNCSGATAQVDFFKISASAVVTVNKLTIRDTRFLPSQTQLGDLINMTNGGAAPVINEANIINCFGRYPNLTSFWVLVNSTCTLTRINFIGGGVTGGAAFIPFRSASTIGTTVTFSGGWEASNMAHVASCTAAGTFNFIFAGCRLDSISSGAFNTSTATFNFYGDALTTSGTFAMLTRAGSEAVSAYGNSLPFDLSTLTRTVGEYCTDSANKTTTGIMPCVCTTTSASGWKNLAGGSF